VIAASLTDDADVPALRTRIETILERRPLYRGISSHGKVTR
jgi:hypothetical protein